MFGLISSRIMTRTTLNLDPSVMRELRRRSEREHKSIGELASQLLARGLHEESEPQPEPFAWVSRDLGEPRVDLEDKEALASLLER
jgi:plasmid stability protein